MRPVRVGCSGWNYRDWRGLFYPPGLPTSRWLEHYSERFSTVEINATFYRLPNRDAVARWVEQTPESFHFTVKSSRFLTHMKRLTDLGLGLERFYERIEPLTRSPKMGPVLWQLPERFHRDDDRLAAALAALPPGRHCFEFRHPSWFCDPVYELLEARGAALVIGDHPERPFQPYRFTTDWTLVRFHYGHRGRGGNYSRTEVADWAARIAAWREQVEVLAYFNNDWKGYAIRNALDLARTLGTGPAAVRPAAPAAAGS